MSSTLHQSQVTQGGGGSSGVSPTLKPSHPENSGLNFSSNQNELLIVPTAIKGQKSAIDPSKTLKNTDPASGSGGGGSLPQKNSSDVIGGGGHSPDPKGFTSSMNHFPSAVSNDESTKDQIQGFSSNKAAMPGGANNQQRQKSDGGASLSSASTTITAGTLSANANNERNTLQNDNLLKRQDLPQSESRLNFASSKTDGPDMIGSGNYKANTADSFGNSLGGGDDTTSSVNLSKKPQFMFVCMEPTKEQRPAQNQKQGTQVKGIDKSASLIDPATLSRILRLQKQQSLIIKGQISTSTGQSSQYFGNTLNLLNGGSSSTAIGIRGMNLDQGNMIIRPIRLDMDKIGICGIPSLWVSRDELIQGSHLSREQLEENERLERFLRILQCHKKYENDKYFGGNIFKRTQGINTSGMINLTNQGGQSITLGGANTSQLANQAEYIWFSIENLAKLKQSGGGGNLGGDKDGVSENYQVQVFPQARSQDPAEALSFKILQAEAKLVRLILESHGFVQTEQNDWNILWTCTSSLQKQYIYENLLEYQRINHFLSSSELTRKDRLCYNVGKMQQKFGKDHFDFLPETYILPDELPEFQKQFNLRAALQRENSSAADESVNRNLWIVKPSSSSQGKGIFMIDDLSELQLSESQVISRYIDNPLLINGLKFDLRLYVLVTNFDPLKIYVYNEGLVRFASEPYNLETIKSNVYAHLTNYSINKKSENFVQNKNLTERDFGNKWSLSALQKHLERLGIDMKAVWSRMYDAIIKSIISVEGSIVSQIKRVQNASGGSIKSNCFDLFGFDIILDSDLKPWILEVNLSPSLAFDSPLDFHIKSNLIIDALNVVGIRKQNRNKDGNKRIPNGGAKAVKAMQPNVTQQYLQPQQAASNSNTLQQSQQNQGDQKKRLSAHSSTMANMQSQSQLAKLENTSLEKQPSSQQHHHHSYQSQQSGGNLFNNANIEISHMERLSKISAKHRELLREHLEEFCIMRQFVNVPGSQHIAIKTRKHNFTRIFPAPGTNSYDMYFSNEQQQQSNSAQQKQYNKILYRYLYDKSSELQDILNQIIKQNEHLLQESQRRASQNKTMQKSSIRENLNDSLERIQKGEFYDKIGGETSNGAGGTTLEPSSQTTSKPHVIVTSITESTQNLITSSQTFQKQPRSHSQIATKNLDSSSSPDFDNTQKSNLQTIAVNNSSQLSSFSPNNQDKKRGGAVNTTGGPTAALNTNENNQQASQKFSDILYNSISPTKDFSPQKQFNQASQPSIQSIEPFQISTTSKQLPLSQQPTNTALTTTLTLKPQSSLDGHSPSEHSSTTATTQQQLQHSPMKENASFRKTSTTSASGVDAASTASNIGGGSDGRIIVTGDDILIEYVRRIMNLIKQCNASNIEVSGPAIRKLELFIGHKIWQPKEERNKNQSPGKAGILQNSTSSGFLSAGASGTIPMWQRIEKRFYEMGERKRRLFIKKHSAAMGSSQQDTKKLHDQLEKLFRAHEKQKADIVKDFSSNELELMLMQSNKNNPIEVVTLLLSLNPAQIGGTPGTASQQMIYNSVGSQSNQGGVLTKLEQDASKGKQDGALLINEKSFDSGQYTTPNGRGVQNSILSQLRSSEDNMPSAGLIAAVPPSSSQSSKKDPFNTSQGLEAMKATNSTLYHGSHNSIAGSNPSLMNNFANSSIGSSNIKGGQSKSKNQGSFDRSDIAMQTGLTLTQNSNKLGQILLQNQQDKKTMFPSITNVSNQMAQNIMAQTSAGSGFQQQYHSTNSNQASYITNGSLSSTSGGGSYPSFSASASKAVGLQSYLQSQAVHIGQSYTQHQSMSSVGAGLIKTITASSVLGGANGLANTTINGNNINNNVGGGFSSDTQTGPASNTKYRVNKINGAGTVHHAISMSPGGAGGISGITDSKFALNKNLRAGASGQQQEIMQ